MLNQGNFSDMLTNSPIRPTILLVDLNQAKGFYETILVLKPVLDNNDNTTSSIAIFECGNNTLIETLTTWTIKSRPYCGYI